MFDADAFVAECQTALGASQPMLTIKEILDRAVSEPDAVATALHAEPGVAVLRRSVDLTVVSVLILAGLPQSLPHDIAWVLTFATWQTLFRYAPENYRERSKGDGHLRKQAEL